MRISDWSSDVCSSDLGQNINRDQQGVGDFTVFGRYTAYEFNARGQTFRIAPFLGVKAPTGDSQVRDGLGRLPPPLQPGSGSWDVLGGAALTWPPLDFESARQVNYKAERMGAVSGKSVS